MPEPTLYIVSTPIGNLADMTPRAVATLKQVDLIAAEDTRHSKRLLNHFGVETPMLPCHDHNERQQAERLVHRLRKGASVALISDAGTPLISDPGYLLVRAAREAGIKVVPVPGACALIAALSVSGLATDRFYFEGFLPAKSSARKKKLIELSALPVTWVFYESTHRIRDCLADTRALLGDDRYIVLAREMTKTFETVLAGSVEHVLRCLEQDANQCRGEFVVLVEGVKPALDQAIDSEAKMLLKRLLRDLPIKKAAAVVADISGYNKKELYNLALTFKA
ncbi:16S rRNA (cytidine(1402)-2'-O)-methyltransferase [Candidatus Sororendozoicomonas aggregata]|uniref:16S rRNA (cytidine(1402)-2'-O)-methyltransferase n=1 Tax=Candidatus Sororendozoicomonas aggregata TaxID=3073239 RepID=UPI002ED427D7